MLANLLEQFTASSVIDTKAVNMTDMHDVRMLDSTLSRDDLAEFTGGFLYGASKRTID